MLSCFNFWSMFFSCIVCWWWLQVTVLSEVPRLRYELTEVYILIFCKMFFLKTQVVSQKDGYIPATPIEGTILVNIGDLLQRWTNDKLVSTVSLSFQSSLLIFYLFCVFSLFSFYRNIVLLFLVTKCVACLHVSQWHFLFYQIMT